MNDHESTFSTKLPSDILMRLRLHAVDRGVEIREVVKDALDAHLPHVKLVEESARRAGR